MSMPDGSASQPAKLRCVYVHSLQFSSLYCCDKAERALPPELQTVRVPPPCPPFASAAHTSAPMQQSCNASFLDCLATGASSRQQAGVGERRRAQVVGAGGRQAAGGRRRRQTFTGGRRALWQRADDSKGCLKERGGLQRAAGSGRAPRPRAQRTPPARPADHSDGVV